MRLIEADELKTAFPCGESVKTECVRATIDHMPTIEPKKGKWIYDGDCYRCNKCGAVYGWWADSQTSNFCPNCGAGMREGKIE